MSKQVKQWMMDDIKNRVGDATDFIVVDASRLDAVSENKLRLTLREKDIYMLTVKNKIAQIALGDAGKALKSSLSGPSTIVWGGEDVVALSKEITKWVKEIEEVELKGAAVEGESLDEAGVVALSKSPGRLELLSQISGLILSPGAYLNGQLLGAGGYLGGQIKKISESEEDAE